MSVAIGVLMMVLMVALVVAKAWSVGHLDAALKGLICGLGVGAWFGVAFYLIAGGAA